MEYVKREHLVTCGQTDMTKLKDAYCKETNVHKHALTTTFQPVI